MISPTARKYFWRKLGSCSRAEVMSTLATLVLTLSFLLSVTIADEPTDLLVCAEENGETTCSAPSSPYDRATNETLGQYLLRQNALKNAQSTHRPSKAMSIRMVNPNNKAYGMAQTLPLHCQFTYWWTLCQFRCILVRGSQSNSFSTLQGISFELSICFWDGSIWPCFVCIDNAHSHSGPN